MQLRDAVPGDIVGRAMVARIATVSRTGRPHVNPLYFVIGDGHVHLGTATYTLAAHNVEANPTVQVLLQVERDGLDTRMLRLDGRAVVRTDAALLRSYRRRVARKYVVSPRGLWNMLAHPRQWLPLRRRMQDAGACVIDVTPISMRVEEVRVADASETVRERKRAGVARQGERSSYR